MPIRPELLVRGLDGRPQPPADLLARIRRYDERLGLFYTNASWAITESWRPDDVRMHWVKDGSVQPEMAFDICGYLPMTCSVEEAPAYIEHQLRSYTAEEWKTLRESVDKWNNADNTGHDAVLQDQLLGEIDNTMTKDGPSIGVFNVPAQVVDNSKTADPTITAALGNRRKKKD